MATLTFSLQTGAGTVSPTSPDFNESRYLDWLWENYAPVDADGNKLARTTANEAQAHRNHGAALWNGVKAAVLQYERNVAAEQARDAVTDIET